MAKCVASVTSWTVKTKDQSIDSSRLESFGDDVHAGEALLNKRLEAISIQILSIGGDFMLIRHSASDSEDRWDCSQVQSAILEKLYSLISCITGVISEICNLDRVITATRHRYFIHFTCGTIHKMKQLYQIVGRLSDLDPKLYYEEQLKPLVCDQSIAIHSLTSIWSATISIMIGFIEPARDVIFKEQMQSDEYSFLEELDFLVAGKEHAKIFLMDLIVTSWIKYNRLIKFDDLAKGSPFLCPCHLKQFLTILGEAFKSPHDPNLLNDLLHLVIDPQSRPSLMTQSIKKIEIIPIEPQYNQSDPFTRSYFVAWHLYSLSRFVHTDPQKDMIKHCFDLLDDCIETLDAQFSVASQQSKNNRLSPHQDERFMLMFIMVNHWCEFMPKDSVRILSRVFSLFDEYWDCLGKNYFDNSSFRVNGLTIFQLFTKLVNDLNPSPTSKASDPDGRELSRDEIRLTSVWDRLLARVDPKPRPPQAAQQV